MAAGGISDDAIGFWLRCRELPEMKVAIVHYWLTGMRGGERFLEALLDLYPEADIFTHVYVPEAVSAKIRAHTVHTTFINRLPRAARWYRFYLPLMPLALEGLDLTGYDLIISSESGPAKGVLAPASALHVCYCHSPMRYVWDFYHRYRREAGWFSRLAMPLCCHYLRLWDVTSAARVDAISANSTAVAGRIRRAWGRADVTVLLGPIRSADFDPTRPRGDRYLFLGELIAYKQPETAVEACLALGRPLTIIGGGPLLGRIRRLARGHDVEVLGRQPYAAVRERLATCRALLFPGEEDFGLVPVEAMASGAPVIASARGGALDTVVDGETGVLYPGETSEDLVRAIQRFEGLGPFDPARCARRAAFFDVAAFCERFSAFVAAARAARNGGRD